MGLKLTVLRGSSIAAAILDASLARQNSGRHFVLAAAILEHSEQLIGGSKMAATKTKW